MNPDSPSLTAHTVCTTYVFIFQQSTLSSLKNPELQTLNKYEIFQVSDGKKGQDFRRGSSFFGPAICCSFTNNVVFQTVLWQLSGRTSRCGKNSLYVLSRSTKKVIKKTLSLPRATLYFEAPVENIAKNFVTCV